MARKAAPKPKPKAKPKVVDKPVKTDKPATKVACPDCEVPRRDDVAGRSSGLKDHYTACETCEGSGQVRPKKSKK